MATFPRIDRPCPLNWNALPDAGGTHCGPCNKQVHNLSAMSERERTGFLARSEGSVCVAYTVNRRTPPAVAAWLMAAAVGTLAGAASAETSLPPVPLTAAIVGAVDGDKGDAVLQPMIMVGAVIDPQHARKVDDADVEALPELPTIVDEPGQE